MISFRALIPVLFVSLVGACSSGAGQDKNNPATGGTRTEMAYQVAIRQADQGFCASAMPMFVCLASQGPGWEVAATRAGRCASIAAKLWKPAAEIEESHHQRFNWQGSPDSILAEGLRQYRRAANANWPQAQAALAVQLYEAGGNSLVEARHWMERYDANPRRKIYGGNAIPIAIRKQLQSARPSGPMDVMWSPTPFVAEDLHNQSCSRLIAQGNPHAPKQQEDIADEDGLEKTEPRKTHGGNDTQPRDAGGHGDH